MAVPAAYIRRPLEPSLRRAAREWPAVALTGPRQSGKTTLLQHLFSGTHGYVPLEPPDIQASASAEPRGFPGLHDAPVIFDGVQHAPGLPLYIKERIDARRSGRGLYLLSGSQNLALASRATEPLAGRVAVPRLLPLSMREQDGQPERELVWEAATRRPNHSSAVYSGLWEQLPRGGHPELAAEPERDISPWHSSTSRHTSSGTTVRFARWGTCSRSTPC